MPDSKAKREVLLLFPWRRSHRRSQKRSHRRNRTIFCVTQFATARLGLLAISYLRMPIWAPRHFGQFLALLGRAQICALVVRCNQTL